MAYNKQYKDFLEISPNFESVVDIDADKRNQNLWREYIVGDDMENLVDVLCQSLGNVRPRMPGDRFGCMALTALVKAMQLFL